MYLHFLCHIQCPLFISCIRFAICRFTIKTQLSSCVMAPQKNKKSSCVSGASAATEICKHTNYRRLSHLEIPGDTLTPRPSFLSLRRTFLSWPYTTASVAPPCTKAAGKNQPSKSLCCKCLLRLSGARVGASNHRVRPPRAALHYLARPCRRSWSRRWLQRRRGHAILRVAQGGGQQLGYRHGH